MSTERKKMFVAVYPRMLRRSLDLEEAYLTFSMAQVEALCAMTDKNAPLVARRLEHTDGCMAHLQALRDTYSRDYPHEVDHPAITTLCEPHEDYVLMIENGEAFAAKRFELYRARLALDATCLECHSAFRAENLLVLHLWEEKFRSNAERFAALLDDLRQGA